MGKLTPEETAPVIPDEHEQGLSPVSPVSPVPPATDKGGGKLK